MKDADLISALRQLKINTSSITCLGCEHENGCCIHGCRLIGMAADTIEKYSSAIESIEEMYSAANGVGKSYLRDVLKLFHIYMPPFPEPLHMVYDFEICKTESSVIMCLDYINIKQWQLISVTYGPMGYSLFFRRPAQD